MRKILLLLTLFLSLNSVYSQLFVEDVIIKDSALSAARGKEVFRVKYLKAKDSVLVKMDIKDKKLYPILDSIMAYETKCKYYTDSLSYCIYIYKDKAKIAIQISSDHHPSSILNSYYKGYFYYRGKQFGVLGDYWDTLFTKTEQYKRFSYKVYYPSVGEENSIWFYEYVDFKFVLEGYCRCNDEKAIYLIPPTKGEKIVY